MKHLNDTIQEIHHKCQLAINDPWHNLPCVMIPIKTINQLINAVQDCHTELDKNLKYDQIKETAVKCLNILELFSHEVMSKPEAKIGDGITKNLAIIEAMKLIKKEFSI